MSPLGVREMWQFQPVSRPIFSANTCKRQTAMNTRARSPWKQGSVVAGGGSPYLAFELILQREVDEANAGIDQPVDEAHDVQPGLVLGGHHAHEDLATQGLHAVFLLQHLPDPFFR